MTTEAASRSSFGRQVDATDSWAPLEVRLQRLPYTRDKLRELSERWNNRLVLEGLADSDEAGHAFRFEAGHLFRSEAGRGSDLMSATLPRLYGSAV